MFYELTLLILLGLLSKALMKRVTSRRLHVLNDMSDEEFINVFNKTFSHFPDTIVMKERRFIAEELEISPLKLSPLQTFDELSKSIEFSIGSRIGLGHLRDDLLELFEHAGIERSTDYFPSTIGETIYEIVIAKKAIENRGKQR